MTEIYNSGPYLIRLSTSVRFFVTQSGFVQQGSHRQQTHWTADYNQPTNAKKEKKKVFKKLKKNNNKKQHGSHQQQTHWATDNNQPTNAESGALNIVNCLINELHQTLV